ncbi:ATP-dependent DNA helicase [Acrasis kona]|uniref:ATP-dependent DNA helicase n=1 Tax=Acrasis kona TaxID=1008807 RepID=A0AAW2ZBJ1_9EUKA
MHEVSTSFLAFASEDKTFQQNKERTIIDTDKEWSVSWNGGQNFSIQKKSVDPYECLFTPVNVKPDCWYGRECRTMVHNPRHAQNYNHDCENVSGKRRPQSNPTTKQVSGESIKLNKEQQEVLDMVESGKNVLFTGCAGTGKSLVDALTAKYRGQHNALGISAFSGIAAVNIGGCTLNHLLDISKGGKYHLSWITNQRLAALKSLVIDEVSMMSANIFDAANAMLTFIRYSEHIQHNFSSFHTVATSEDTSWEQFTNAFITSGASAAYLPFGGVQIILVGDFLQLSPIEAAYCFEAKTWNTTIPSSQIIQTNTIYRQKALTFVNFLNQIRAGQLGPEEVNMLERLKSNTLLTFDHILPTRVEINDKLQEGVNQSSLDKLPGPCFQFPTQDLYSNCSDKKMQQSLEHILSQKCNSFIDLRIGAQVVLTSDISIESDLINGSRGVVVGFQFFCQVALTDSKFIDYAPFASDFRFYTLLPIVRFVNQKTIAIKYEVFKLKGPNDSEMSRMGLPLNLAWSTTIYKCQGMCLDKVSFNLKYVNAPAMGYVALSRAKDSSCIELFDYDKRIAWASEKALQFYGLQASSNNKMASPKRFNRRKYEQSKQATSSADVEFVMPEGVPNCLSNLSFVITGQLQNMSRADAGEQIKKYGGVVKSGLSKKLNYLLAGADAGPAKMEEAKKNGTKIISEEEFVKLIADSSSRVVTTPPSTPPTTPKRAGAIVTPSSTNGRTGGAITPPITPGYSGADSVTTPPRRTGVAVTPPSTSGRTSNVVPPPNTFEFSSALTTPPTTPGHNGAVITHGYAGFTPHSIPAHTGVTFSPQNIPGRNMFSPSSTYGISSALATPPSTPGRTGGAITPPITPGYSGSVITPPGIPGRNGALVTPPSTFEFVNYFTGNNFGVTNTAGVPGRSGSLITPPSIPVHTGFITTPPITPGRGVGEKREIGEVMFGSPMKISPQKKTKIEVIED